MRLKALFIAFLAAFCALPARAEDYPARALHIITANSVGGTSDIFVRALADKLQLRLGQPIVVENRPGGNMTIAGRACADAVSDGYTICLLPNETLTLNQFTYKSIPYDPEKDFAPITNAFINTQVMVVKHRAQCGLAGRACATVKSQARNIELPARSLFRCRSRLRIGRKRAAPISFMFRCVVGRTW